MVSGSSALLKAKWLLLAFLKSIRGLASLKKLPKRLSSRQAPTAPSLEVLKRHKIASSYSTVKGLSD